MADMTERMSIEKGNGQRTALLTGLTAAGGTGAALVLARRARRRKRSTAQRMQAVAIEYPSRFAKTASSRLQDPEWRLWGLAGIAVAWFVVRMAELRQLRRMARALVASRA
jgi:hypothetical protein